MNTFRTYQMILHLYSAMDFLAAAIVVSQNEYNVLKLPIW